MPLTQAVLTEKLISYMVNAFYLCLDLKQLLGILYIGVCVSESMMDSIFYRPEKELLGTKICDTFSP